MDKNKIYQIGLRKIGDIKYMEYKQSLSLKNKNQKDIQKKIFSNLFNPEKYTYISDKTFYKLSKKNIFYKDQKEYSMIKILPDGRVYIYKYKKRDFYFTGEHQRETKKSSILYKFPLFYFFSKKEEGFLHSAILYFYFLKKESLLDFVIENLCFFLSVNKIFDLHYIKKVYTNKKYFTQKTFNSNYNKETELIVRTYKDIDLSFAKEIFLYFKHLSIKEIEDIILNPDLLKEVNKKLKSNLIFFLKLYGVFRNQLTIIDISKSIKDVNLLNKTLKIKKDALSFFVKNNLDNKEFFMTEEFSKDPFFVKRFKIFLYIYTKLFKYSDSIFVNNYFKNAFYTFCLNDETKLNYFYEQQYLMNHILLRLDKLSLNRSWRKMFKNLFKIYTEINPYWKKKKFNEKAVSFFQFICNLSDDVYFNNYKKIKEDKINFITHELIEALEEKINDYSFVVLKSKYDYIYYGNLMHNCLPKYFEQLKIKKRKRVVVVCLYKNKNPVFAIEILFNKTKYYDFKFTQILKKFNRPVNNNKEKKLIEEYKESIKKNLKTIQSKNKG